MKRRPSNPFALSQQYILEAEARVAEQRRGIARLKSSGRSCDEAAAALRREELALLKLRNHAQLMRTLIDTNPETNGSDSSGQEVNTNELPTETSESQPASEQRAVVKLLKANGNSRLKAV